MISVTTTLSGGVATQKVLGFGIEDNANTLIVRNLDKNAIYFDVMKCCIA